MSFDWGDCLHFPQTFILQKEIFLVEYLYLAVIKLLYQEPLTKISSILPLIILNYFRLSVWKAIHHGAGWPSTQNGSTVRTHRSLPQG